MTAVEAAGEGGSGAATDRSTMASCPGANNWRCLLTCINNSGSRKSWRHLTSRERERVRKEGTGTGKSEVQVNSNSSSNYRCKNQQQQWLRRNLEKITTEMEMARVRQSARGEEQGRESAHKLRKSRAKKETNGCRCLQTTKQCAEGGGVHNFPLSEYEKPALPGTFSYIHK